MGARQEKGRPVQPIYVRVADAPAVLGLSRDSIERAHKRGELAIYKPVGVALLKIEEVSAWIERHGADVGQDVGRAG